MKSSVFEVKCGFILDCKGEVLVEDMVFYMVVVVVSDKFFKIMKNLMCVVDEEKMVWIFVKYIFMDEFDILDKFNEKGKY